MGTPKSIGGMLKEITIICVVTLNFKRLYIIYSSVHTYLYFKIVNLNIAIYCLQKYCLRSR